MTAVVPPVVHKPDRWLLWYNGRRESVEQIGLATHDRDDLGIERYRSSSASARQVLGEPFGQLDRGRRSSYPDPHPSH
jgi:hypothetical protein